MQNFSFLLCVATSTNIGIIRQVLHIGSPVIFLPAQDLSFNRSIDHEELYLKGFDTNQFYAQAYLHEIGFGFGLLFFGATWILNGYLIYRSGYMPKLLGVLLVIAGVSYLSNTLTPLLTPDFRSILFPFVLLPSFIAELSFCGWLLFRAYGLNAGNDN